MSYQPCTKLLLDTAKSFIHPSQIKDAVSYGQNRYDYIVAIAVNSICGQRKPTYTIYICVRYTVGTYQINNCYLNQQLFLSVTCEARIRVFACKEFWCCNGTQRVHLDMYKRTFHLRLESLRPFSSWRLRKFNH